MAERRRHSSRDTLPGEGGSREATQQGDAVDEFREAQAARLSQLIRRTVGKWVSDTYRRRPMIIPTVLEV